MSDRTPLLTELAAPGLAGRTLLAIDTAMGTSVAVGAGGRIVQAASPDPMGHAEVIGELIAAALAGAGVAAGEVDGVVAGMGPGPFTGLRVGIAAAVAFGRGRGLTALPLLSHEAVALAAFRSAAPPASVTVLQDARRRELFVSRFLGLDADGLPIPAGEPSLALRADTEAAPPADALWPAEIPAARLVELAALRLAAGRDFAGDGARYLRAPDVRQPGAPKRVNR